MEMKALILELVAVVSLLIFLVQTHTKKHATVKCNSYEI